MQQRNRAVDAAAHGHSRAARGRRCDEDLAESGRERLDREGLAADRRRLEQRQARDGALEAFDVSVEDALIVDDETRRGPLVPTSRVAEDLHRCHELRLDDGRPRSGPLERCSTLPMMPRPLRTWLRQVGAVRGVGNAYPRRRLPSRVCWFTFEPRPRTGSSARILVVARSPPLSTYAGPLSCRPRSRTATRSRPSPRGRACARAPA